MRVVQDVFALITTDALMECRDFYVKHFGFITVFETDIYLQLAVEGKDRRSFSLAFMPTDHPFGVVGREPVGLGLMLTLQVEDSALIYERVRASGARIVHAITDEAWGQRRFVVTDPAGVHVDVVQLIDPAPGFYDRYPVRVDLSPH